MNEKMQSDIKKIKILTETFNVSQAEDAVKDINGILDAKISGDTLSYIIDEHASDYDIMVAVMNTLETELSIESEPYFDEDDAIPAPVYEENDTFDEGEAAEEENGKESVSDKDVKKEERKGRFIELCISAVALIAGFILGAFEKTAKISDYVKVVAFAIAGYEAMFGGVKRFIKKDFFNSDLIITLSSVVMILLSDAGAAAIISLAYSLCNFLTDIAEDKVRASVICKITSKNEELKNFDTEFGALKKFRAAEKFITPAVFAVALLAAFIPPAFKSDYASALYKTAYGAALILAVLPLTSVSFALTVNAYFAFLKCVGSDAVADLNALDKLGSVSAVAFDENAVIKDGKINSDASGAVMELYDAKIKDIELLSSAGKEETKKLRKELGMNKSASMLTSAEDKENELNELKKEHKGGEVLFVGNQNLKNEFLTISVGDNLRKVPYLIKVAVRYKKISRVIFVFSAAIRALAIVFAVTGITSSAWFAALTGIITAATGFLLSLLNKGEII